MKPMLIRRSVLLLTATTALTLGLIAWDQQPGSSRTGPAPSSDTTPRKESLRNREVRDLDEVVKELEKALKEVDFSRIQTELNAALQEVNLEKMKAEMEKAFREIDMEKIKGELQEALARVNTESIRKEVETALGELNLDKMKAELKASLENLQLPDGKELKREMEKVQAELKEIQPKLRAEMEKAKEEMQKAKQEITALKDFVNSLHEDGLLDKNKPYEVRHRDGVLTINGKTAGEATLQKHRSFLGAHPRFRLIKDAENFRMEKD